MEVHEDDVLESLIRKIIKLAAYVTESQVDTGALADQLDNIKHLWRAALHVQTLDGNALVEGTLVIQSSLKETRSFHYLAEKPGNSQAKKFSEIVLSVNRPKEDFDVLAFDDASLESHTEDELKRILQHRIRLILRRYWISQQNDVKKSLVGAVHECFRYEKWYAQEMEKQLKLIKEGNINHSETPAPINLQCNDDDFHGCYENMLLLVLSSSKSGSQIDQEVQLKEFSRMMVEMFSSYKRIAAYFDTDYLVFFNQKISSTVKLLLPREAKRLHGQFFDDFFTIHPVFPELEVLIESMQRSLNDHKEEVSIGDVVDFVSQVTQFYSETDSKCTYYEKCFSDIFGTYITILSEHGGDYAVLQDPFFSKIKSVYLKWQNKPISVTTWNEELRSLCKLMFSEPSATLSISPSPEMRYAILRYKREFNIKTEYLQIWYRLMERRLCDAELLFIWNKYYLNHSLRKWFEKLHRHHVATGQAMLLNNMRLQRSAYQKWRVYFAKVLHLQKTEQNAIMKRCLSKLTSRHSINRLISSQSDSIAKHFVIGSFFRSWALLSRRNLQMQKVNAAFSVKFCFSIWRRKHASVISMDQNATSFRDSIVAGKYLLLWSSRSECTGGLLKRLEKVETTFVKKKFLNLWIARLSLCQKAEAFKIKAGRVSVKRFMGYWRQRTQEKSALSTYCDSWELSVKRAIVKRWRQLYEMSLESEQYRRKKLLTQTISKWRLVIQEKKTHDKLVSLKMRFFLKKWKLSLHAATLYARVDFSAVRHCFSLWAAQYASMVDQEHRGIELDKRFMQKKYIRLWRLNQRKAWATRRAAEVALQGHLTKANRVLTATKFYEWVDAFLVSTSKDSALDNILYANVEAQLLRRAMASWKESNMTVEGNVMVADEFFRMHLLKKVSGHWWARAQRIRELEFLLAERLEERNAQTLFDLFPKWNIRYIKLQRLYSSAEQFLYRWNNNKKRSIFQIWLENTQQRQSYTVRRRRSISRRTRKPSFSSKENHDSVKDAKLHLYSPAEKPRYTPIAEVGPFIDPGSVIPVTSNPNPPIATPHRRPWIGDDFVPATERIRRFKTQQLKKRYQGAAKSATPSPEKADQESPTRKVSSFKTEQTVISEESPGDILSPKVSPIFVLRQRLQSLKNGPLRPNLVDEPAVRSRFESDSGSSTIIE